MSPARRDRPVNPVRSPRGITHSVIGGVVGGVIGSVTATEGVTQAYEDD